MSLFIASINSGSNGNCYYIGNTREAVLVDVGIPCREIEKRMRRLGLSMNVVKAIFISHEHGDHIKGVDVLSRKYRLPVYITEPTLKHSRLLLDTDLVRPFKPHEPVSIGRLTVNPFPKFHDAADPHSFVVSGNNVNIGVFTDIGTPCEHLIAHFALCHAVFLESNYDDAMLENGRYPRHLKKRISSDVGHLSNRQALELFLAHRPGHMWLVLLAHLSQENNTPERAQTTFTPHAGSVRVLVAPRDKESEVYTIRATPAIKADIKGKQEIQQKMVQATLF